jgi:hypothetical protein
MSKRSSKSKTKPTRKRSGSSAALLAKSGAAGAVAVASVINPVLGVAAAIAQPAAEALTGVVRRRMRRVESFAEGSDEWQATVRRLPETAAGESLLEAVWSDAEDEKQWAYRALASDMHKGNHDHDRALRFVGLLRSLRQRQLLRVIYSACRVRPGLRSWPVGDPEPPPEPPELYERVDDGTINALVDSECYIADIPGPFLDTSLTYDGICFVNLLRTVAPIEWNCEHAPIVGHGKERRGDPIGAALKKRDRETAQYLRSGPRSLW